MNEQGHVLVIGAASLDVKGRPDKTPVQGSSTPGHIRTSIGGVARNIAENLARLEVETVLLTAVGNDSTGEQVLGHAAALGIDVSEALIVDKGRTGTYIAILTDNGTLDMALDDMSVLEALTPRYLRNHRELFQRARMVVLDANPSPESITTVVNLCKRYRVPLCADPTSLSVAARLCPHLPSLYMTVPNVQETQVLCDQTFGPSDRDAALAAAQHLVEMGVETAIITLSEFGVVYADAETKGHVPAIPTHIIDPTGAGDAQTAAIIFGLLEEIPLDECVSLGVKAATLTLRTRETVRPDLSMDLLYDELSD